MPGGHPYEAEIDAAREAVARRQKQKRRRSAAISRELRELRAVVGKLPKTADGVPVVPYTAVWYCFGSTPFALKVVGMRRRNADALGEWHIYGELMEGRCVGEWRELYSADCYSTREAALAAKAVTP